MASGANDDNPKATTPKQKQTLTIDKKMEIIKEYTATNSSCRDLAIKFGIGKSTISDIVRKRKLYEEEYALGNPKMKYLKREGTELNDLVHKFVLMANNLKLPVSGPILKEKASILAAELGIENFKASDGWLKCFRKRYNVRVGESNWRNEKVWKRWMSELGSLVADYPDDCIYMCVETGLYFRAIPSKTHFAKFAQRSKEKTAKDRITVLFACSSTGHKLEPVVIGRCARPCSDQNDYDRSTLGVHCFSNGTALMTNDIFSQWINLVNEEMKGEKKKIVLFLDKCRSHLIPENETEFVKLVFLPPNAASELQTLNGGIVQSYKRNYRQQLLIELVSGMESSGFTKEISIFDAINWTSKAWKAVATTTIINCFRYLGFDVGSSIDEVNIEDSMAEMVINNILDGLKLEEQLSAEEFISIDSDLLTEEVENDGNDLLQQNHESCMTEALVLSDESDVEDLPPPTLQDAKRAAEVLKQFAFSLESSPLIPIAVEANAIISRMIVDCKMQSRMADLK